jgi:hypothetical protein
VTAGQSPRETGGYEGTPASVGWPGRPAQPAGAPVRPTEPERAPVEPDPSQADTVAGSAGPPVQPPERSNPALGSPGPGTGPGTPAARPAMPAGPPVAPPPSRPAAQAARPTATSAMTVGTSAATRKGGRRARLTLKRIDPWSMLKFSFVYSLAGLVVLLVAVVALYSIVDAMGVIDSIRTFLRDIDASKNGQGIAAWLSFSRVLAVALVLGAVNVILFTAFATLTAFVYNVCTDLVGGVEVTLAERG